MISLPRLLCGPSVRRCDESFAWVWLVTSAGIEVEVRLFASYEPVSGPACRGTELGRAASTGNRIGTNAALHLVKVPCSENKILGKGKVQVASALRIYEILYRSSSGELLPLMNKEELKERVLPNQKEMSFLVPRVKATTDAKSRFIVGSCRKIQTIQSDFSTSFSSKALELWSPEDSRPHFLVCCGDQVYADDVSASMWSAIRVIQKEIFGDFDRDKDFTSLSGSARADFVKKELTSASGPYGVSPNPQTHLLTYTEFASLYILNWSPGIVRTLLPESFERFGDIELKAMNVDSIVWQKIFANTVSYFLLDDHEVTDDFRIDREWIKREKTSPRLRRFTGNALLSYLIFQGLGNDPVSFGLVQDAQSWAAKLIHGISGDSKVAEDLDTKQLNWKRWSYSIPNVAPILVLDTRMGRNADSSETVGELQVFSPSKSGSFKTLPVLSTNMFSATELVRCLDEVRTCPFGGSLVIITPTPIFGHLGLEDKIRAQIEVSSDMPKWDYENWRSNPKSFKTLLETIGDNSKYKNIVVVSGDVHCAFQATCKVSFGIKNLNFVQVCSSPLANPLPSVARNLIPDITHSEKYVTFFWQRDGGRSWKALFGATNGSTQVIADVKSKYGTPTWKETTTFSRSEKSPSGTVLFFEPNIATVAISSEYCVSTLLSFDGGAKPSVISKAIFPSSL
jgi:hypothetical protein